MSALVSTALTSGGSVAAVTALIGGVGRGWLRRFLRQETENIINAGLDQLKKDIDARFNEADAKKEAIAKTQSDMALQLATQFGGNGGGMRQAINDLQICMARLEGQMQAQAALKGPPNA